MSSVRLTFHDRMKQKSEPNPVNMSVELWQVHSWIPWKWSKGIQSLTQRLPEPEPVWFGTGKRALISPVSTSWSPPASVHKLVPALARCETMAVKRPGLNRADDSRPSVKRRWLRLVAVVDECWLSWGKPKLQRSAGGMIRKLKHHSGVLFSLSEQKCRSQH